MKKFVKIFSIVMLIVNILAVGVSILSLFRPESIGGWIVTLYEELTNDIGKTIPGMYDKLGRISVIFSCISLGVSAVVFGVNFIYIRKSEKTGEEVKVETIKNSEETMKSKEERALLKAAKKAAKAAAKAAKRELRLSAKEAAKKVIEKIEEKEVADKKVVKNSAAEDFLASLRNRK